MAGNLFEKYVDDAKWDIYERNNPFTFYEFGYLQALSELQNLEMSDAFKIAFPTSADQEKYFDVLYWILKKMREFAFGPEEALPLNNANEKPIKDLRGISSGHLGDPRYFEWDEENS